MTSLVEIMVCVTAGSNKEFSRFTSHVSLNLRIQLQVIPFSHCSFLIPGLHWNWIAKDSGACATWLMRIFWRMVQIWSCRYSSFDSNFNYVFILNSSRQKFPKVITVISLFFARPILYVYILLVNLMGHQFSKEWLRLDMHTRSLFNISRMGGGPGRLGGVLFYIGEIKNFAFFQTRKYTKNFKKSMKIL